MKTLHYIYSAFLALAGFTLASCQNFDEPDTSDYLVTATSMAEPNSTIAQVKERFKAQMTTNNTYTLVTEDIIFEGVVVINDGMSGNLYQTLVVRDINAEEGTDQCIQIGVRYTCLYPFFKLGQRIRVNLNGLHIGNYSKVPKIGTPYRTSLGNDRLGPMVFERVAKNIMLIGEPDPSAPELVPVVPDEAFLGRSVAAGDIYKYSPMLATVSGTIRQASAAQRDVAEVGSEDNVPEFKGVAESLPKTFAPECLRDAGMGVDRDIVLTTGKTVALRTSTGNDISYLYLPTDIRSYTGMLTYYSSWQLQIREKNDIVPAIDETTWAGTTADPALRPAE
ncbi:MAG: hypothetical protein J1F06_06505 [Prevotellaceae bacterium]|nr:hypothetical protein [Prevotellaceae bacterium]